MLLSQCSFRVFPWVRVCPWVRVRLCDHFSSCSHPLLRQGMHLSLLFCVPSYDPAAGDSKSSRAVYPPDCKWQSWMGSSSSACPTAASAVKDVAKKISKGNDSLLRQPEEWGRPRNQSQHVPSVNSIGSNWASLPTPSESSSPIQPGQKAISPSPALTSPASTWKIQQRDPEDYERDREGKYADFFVGNEILLILEIVKKIEPWIVSLVVTDLKTRMLVGLKKENFEDLLQTSGIPCRYFCHRSFATWDVLMPTEEQAARVAANNIATKFFWL